MLSIKTNKTEPRQKNLCPETKIQGQSPLRKLVRTGQVLVKKINNNKGPVIKSGIKMGTRLELGDKIRSGGTAATWCWVTMTWCWVSRRLTLGCPGLGCRQKSRALAVSQRDWEQEPNLGIKRAKIWVNLAVRGSSGITEAIFSSLFLLHSHLWELVKNISVLANPRLKESVPLWVRASDLDWWVWCKLKLETQRFRF